MNNTKLCSTCTTEQPLVSFPKNKRYSDGHTNKCKSCTCAHFNKWYAGSSAESRRKKYNNSKSLKESNRKYIFNYLANSKGCAVCGIKNPIMLDFHHLGDKSGDIGNFGESWSIDRIHEEINKCIILCANHHRVITARDLNWYSYIDPIELTRYFDELQGLSEFG